ncbi:hypothetical protein EYF80_019137 [Liparis tanakae]|uniref:Uncharacterized protein n=1 Tax=Liparis tanakae TaxID=230148 RepID=A0A4Z2HYT5_9TELE|nr:hypothetical protein EYF80_019137 [Liparis tanakae]
MHHARQTVSDDDNNPLFTCTAQLDSSSGLQGTCQQQNEVSFKFTATSTSPLGEVKYKNDWYAH